MASLQAGPAIPELFADLLKQVSTLVAIELDLARAELSLSFERLAGGVGKVAVGAVLLLAGLFFVLAAICAFLVRLGLPVDLACLAVGAVVTIVGYLLLRWGTDAFVPSKLLPRRSLAQISSLMRRS
jgi:hypothetical protein